MNSHLYILGLLLTLSAIGCVPEEGEIPLSSRSGEQFYLVHDGAQMPVIVEGNTLSRTFILVVHGGPGGNAMVYNNLLKAFSDPLEEQYGMVYWDQRGSGNSLGNYDIEALTIEQYVEDLDALVELMFHRYGEDIKLFLMGHSWGGLLTAAYLTEDGFQDKITGWIEVDGAHSFQLINETAPDLMLEIGRQQIDRGGSRLSEWEEIVEYCEGLSNNLSLDEVIQVNRYANQADVYLLEEGVTATGVLDSGDVIDFYFTSNHNSVTSLFNLIMTSNAFVEEIAFVSYSDRMQRITIPSLFLWGEFDMVVPPALAEDAYNMISTPSSQKEIIIFNQSGHSPMVQEPIRFSLAVEQFVEKYR